MSHVVISGHVCLSRSCITSTIFLFLIVHFYCVLYVLLNIKNIFVIENLRNLFLFKQLITRSPRGFIEGSSNVIIYDI